MAKRATAQKGPPEDKRSVVSEQDSDDEESRASEESSDQEATDEAGADDAGKDSDQESDADEDDDEEDANEALRANVKWLRETVETMVAGSRQEPERRPTRRNPGAGRTVVRVQDQPPKAAPLEPPVRRTKRLTFGGFGLRKARRTN